MELYLFLAFLFVGLILVGLGLFFSEHTELAIIGFGFIFILSGLLLSGSVTQKTGEVTNVTCIYDAGNLTGGIEQTDFIYDNITWDGTLNKSLGFWLGVLGVIGFVGVMIALRRSRREE